METELNEKHIERIETTVREINLSEIFKPRVIRFNGIRGIAPFGTVGETLDKGVIFLPKLRRIFHATGVCFSLDEIQHKIYASNLLYRDLITKDVRRQLKWFYEFRKKDPEGYQNFLNYGVNVNLNNYPEYAIPVPEYLENFKVDVVEYKSFAFPGWHSDKHTNYKRDVIELAIPTDTFFNGMGPEDIGIWLKKQIANINTVALYLEPEAVDENYLRIFMCSKSGYVFLQQWLNLCEDDDVLSAVKRMTILLPDLREQKRIGDMYAKCLEEEKRNKDVMIELSELIHRSLHKKLAAWTTCDFFLKDYCLSIPTETH